MDARDTAGEQEAVRAIITALEKQGWKPRGYDDGGDETTKEEDAGRTVEAVFSVSECRVFFASPDRRGQSVLFVQGNGPTDVAADWTVGDRGFAAAMDKATSDLEVGHG